MMERFNSIFQFGQSVRTGLAFQGLASDVGSSNSTLPNTAT